MNRSAIITFALALGLFVPAVTAVSATPADAAVRVEIGLPVVVLGVPAPIVVEHDRYRDERLHEARHIAYERHAAYDRHLEARALRHEVRVVREVRYVPSAYDPYYSH